MYSLTQCAADLKAHVVDDLFHGTSNCVESCNEVLHTKMLGQLGEGGTGREEFLEGGGREEEGRRKNRKEGGRKRGRGDIG